LEFHLLISNVRSIPLKSIKIIFSIPFLAAVIFLGNLSAQGVNYNGTSSANFLKIGMGAKYVASAESDLSLSEDASSLFFNPGTISRIGGNSSVFSYSTWLVQTNLTSFAAVLPFSFLTAGLDIIYFSSGNIDETTLYKQDGTGRVISANDLSLGLTIAKNLTDRFSVGVKVKYVREQLASVNADAFAFDIGSVFETSFLNNMKIGISLSNFGGTMKFNGNELLVTYVVPGSPTGKQIPAVLETKQWDLPLVFKIGVSTEIYKNENFRWCGSYLINDTRDYLTRHNLGTSITLMNILTLRGGYRLNYDETTFSAGFGFVVPAEVFGKIFFDYAFTDFGKLSNIHKLILAVNF